MARKGQGTEIVESWQGGVGGEDFLRGVVERVVQQVLETEMTSFLGAGNYERGPDRRGWRNGYKPRTLKTRVGELELMVPKDREGEFQSELFERYQRSEKALVLAMLQMYIEGVSTRKVRAITEALCGLEVSKSQVSALTQKLDAEIAEWRQRPLREEYPYLVIDARYEKVRRGGEVVSQGVLVAVGISAAGYREVLGAWVAESESEASWGEVFSELKQRGLRGVRYLVSDDHAGMVRAIGRHFQNVAWQRCQVHFVRNALSLCGVRERPLVLRLMKTITESPSREAAKIAIQQAVAELEKKAPRVARLLEEHGEDILGVYTLPEAHRKRMRTTNLLERQNQELKRRTRVVRVFPHQQSCLRLVCALLMETNHEWMERLYLRMDDAPPLAEATAANAA
ncbi:MAG: IS256 family transposase [Pseudonocardiaceae bacterium]